MAQQPIHEFDPHDCLTPLENRIHTLEMLKDLIASIRVNGQQVPGAVMDHPTERGKYLVVMGNGRKEACKFLGIKFKAILLERVLTLAEQVKLRLTENVIRRGMTPLEIGSDILLYIRETGCTQAQAGEKLGLSQGAVSRYLTVRNLPEDLRQLVADGKLEFSSSYAVATLPTLELKREAAKRIVEGGLKKEQAIALVDAMKGRKAPKQTKKKRVTLSFDLTDSAPASALIEQLKAVIARLQKLGDVPPEALARFFS